MYGDNRPYSVALVYPDWELLRAWAEKNAGAKEGMSLEDLGSIEAVRHLIAGEIAIALEGFKKFEVRSYGNKKPLIMDYGASTLNGLNITICCHFNPFGPGFQVLY